MIWLCLKMQFPPLFFFTLQNGGIFLTANDDEPLDFGVPCFERSPVMGVEVNTVLPPTNKNTQCVFVVLHILIQTPKKTMYPQCCSRSHHVTVFAASTLKHSNDVYRPCDPHCSCWYHIPCHPWFWSWYIYVQTLYRVTLLGFGSIGNMPSTCFITS